MAAPTTTVTVFFGTVPTGDGIFKLNDSLLDGADVLGGDTGTDVTGYVNSISIRRGRPSQLFEAIDPATGTIQLNNETRIFDPMYAAGTFYGFIKPGLRVVVTTNGVVIFDGLAADWNLEYDVSGRSIARLEIEDALAVLGRQEFDEWTATDLQAPGARIEDVLNRTEVAWPGGPRDIDDGAEVLQGDLVTWGSNALNYAQLVAQSDLGAFFASRDGLLTYRDRRYHLTASVTPLAFADDGTGIAFQGVASTFGAEVYFNRVLVDREGGIAQTFTAASATDDGIRSLTLAGLLLSADLDAYRMAEYLADLYSTGDTRISMLRVMLDDLLQSTSDINLVLALDLTGLVSVAFTPNGVGAAIEQTCAIQGIDWDITPDACVVSFWLSKHIDPDDAFFLDSSLLDGADLLVF
jgi:hypothetical protein